MLTQDRAEMLAEYMEADLQRAKALFEMDVEDALVKINADGYDFTVEELQEFALELEKASQNSEGELGEDELETVAGGCPSSYWVPKVTSWMCKTGLKLGLWIKDEISNRYNL